MAEIDFTRQNDVREWFGQTFHEYQKVDLVQDWMMSTRDLNDSASRTVHIFQKRTPTEYDAGESRWAASGIEERACQLVHNKSIEGVEKLPWEERKKVPYSRAAELAASLAMGAHASKMTRYTSWMIGNTPNGTNNDDALDHVINKDLSSSRASKVEQFLRDAGVLFRRQELTSGPGEWLMFMEPVLFSELWTREGIVRKDWGGEGGVRRFSYRGLPLADMTRVIEYAGWWIFETTGSFDLNLSSGTTVDGAAHGISSKTPSKFKNDCSDFFAVGWHRRTIAQGYATSGRGHIEISAPVWDPDTKSWYFNTALICDLVSIQKAAPTTAALDVDEDTAWNNAPGVGLVALKDSTDETTI